MQKRGGGGGQAFFYHVVTAVMERYGFSIDTGHWGLERGGGQLRPIIQYFKQKMMIDFGSEIFMDSTYRGIFGAWVY